MGHARWRRAGAATALACLVASGCTSSGGGPATNRTSATNLDSVETFAFALGVDANEPSTASKLRAYDLVVVDGEETTADTIEALRADGVVVLAYLSVGTVEPQRRWFDEAEAQGWLLDRWEDWDEWYADVNEPGLRQLAIDVGMAELAKGFDGLFLDNTDMVAIYDDRTEGMANLVADLADLTRLDGGRSLLFAQNGDPTAAGIAEYLDGWNREDVSFTYDFATESYQRVTTEDRDGALETIAELEDSMVLVLTTDYLSADQLVSGSDEATEAIEVACAAGAIGFVGDIELTTLPDQPRRCG